MSDDQTGGEAIHDPDARKKKKKDKVRSAWISFVGRIVAQGVGATATVVLGVMVLQSYSAPNSARATALPHPPGEVFVAILPVENFSANPAGVGRRVRISVQLIESGDQPVTDALALQAEVAAVIARAVSSGLPQGPQNVSR